MRDSIIIFNSRLEQRDTLLHDENLEPSTNYTYTAFAQKSNEKSDEVSANATTMDTTDYEFEWQVFEWGAHSSSVLNGVAIISPDNIWAVGEIYTADVYTYDSLGNWISPYNAVHWDGQKWELERILFPLCPNGTPSASPGTAVFSSAKDDIWFAKGGAMIHWNGQTFINDCSMNTLLKGSIVKI